MTYRRVQGGLGKASSQDRISVDELGNISISKHHRDLNISIDDGSHSEYFLNKRIGAEIVEFDVPKWFDDMVQEYTISQDNYKSNPLNQGGMSPKKSDINTPGVSMEFPSPWIEWIEEYAQNGRIKRKVE